MVQEYIRPYELSIWTLQDEFITVLKWSEVENKGQLQNGSVNLVDDGTQELSFSVPLYYYENGVKINNPLWHDIKGGLIVPNMHKIKLIFNKKEDCERVYEFLIISLNETHEKDEVIYDISCEGLAFHELGKIGYKVSLAPEDYEDEVAQWFNNGIHGDMPMNNIQYWNDKVFKYYNENGIYTWKYDWTYEVQMDWSSHSFSHLRTSDKVYEEDYVSSWSVDEVKDYQLYPRQVEGAHEKWRSVEVSESNIYNITQTIAETFGVFCRYEYEYDDNYHITGRKVIYYNNFIKDVEGSIDLTYPYSSQSITRSIDDKETITKLYVRPVDDSVSAANLISIMNVDANKSREDYLLNFDYLHEVNTITDEQYEYVPVYEGKMRVFNNSLITYESQLDVLKNNIITEEANRTLYTNAIALDKEQYNNAIALRSQLTGGDNVIHITQANPTPVLLKQDTNSSLSNVYYVTFSIQGIMPTTVQLYKTIDYTKKVNEGRLQDRYTGGVFEYDEFKNLVQISNITITEANIKQLYLVCDYNPQLYYDNVAKTWEIRQNKDEAALAETEAKLDAYYFRLGGADTDYAYVDYARVDAAMVEYNNAGDIIKTSYNSVGTAIVGSATWRPKTSLSEAERENERTANPEAAKVAFAEVDDGHGLAYAYDHLLEKKQWEIVKFEKMMGAALREGYWQPENDKAYGDKYLDNFALNMSQNYIAGSTAVASFLWDSEPFENETTLYYELGTTQEIQYYPIINLEAYRDIIANHLTDLSLIYYDENIISLNEAVDNNSVLSAEQKAEYKAANKKNAQRSLNINSTCEFAYVYSSNAQKFIPVLVLTGTSTWTPKQLDFIYTAPVEFRPYLGTINADIIDNAVQIVTTKLITNIEFINYYDTMYSSSLGKYTLAYPRIHISSLALKNTSSELQVSSNTSPLEVNEDYYVLIRAMQENESKNGYYITLKPKAILANGKMNTVLDINYALSNADVSIFLDAREVMKENSTPKVSYEVKLSVLNKDFIRTAYDKLNHIVHINDYELQFNNVNGYISSLKLNLDNLMEDEVEIKNYATKFEDLFSTIVAQTESMKKNENVLNLASQVIGNNGLIQSSVLQESMLKVDLNYAFNQGKLTIDEANGIWGTSDSGVVAFRGGGIFTATQKDESGNWKWNTGILPTGINADLITSGQLDTNKIKIYAGDKVKFQFNGDGLFAYKSLFSEEYPEGQTNLTKYSSYMNAITGSASNTNQEVDASQYVTYNENGLFLICEQGAKILDYSPNNDVGYKTLAQQVKRVEVSWRGFILRDWNNKEVFYADPTTGDLTLEGRIVTNSGEIGGWTINDDSLTSDYIALVSSGSDKMKGIYLTNQSNSLSSTEINGRTYYAYTYGGQTYYIDSLPNSSETTLYVTSSHDCRYYSTYQNAVFPRYTKTKSNSSSHPSGGGSNTDDEQQTITNPGNITIDLVTKTYITDSSGNFIIYGGNYIEYNYSTGLSSGWYDSLTKYIKDIGQNINNYVTFGYTSDYVKTSSLNGETVTLYQFKPTFSVDADTGYTTINKGKLGNFNLTTNSLSDGTLKSVTIDTNSKIVSGSRDYSLDKFSSCFCDITPDSANGQFTLTRVNESTVNFNIASMQYFQDEMARVGAFDPNGFADSHNNNYCYVTMATNYGNVHTTTVDISNVYSNGGKIKSHTLVMDGDLIIDGVSSAIALKSVATSAGGGSSTATNRFGIGAVWTEGRQSVKVSSVTYGSWTGGYGGVSTRYSCSVTVNLNSGYNTPYETNVTHDISTALAAAEKKGWNDCIDACTKHANAIYDYSSTSKTLYTGTVATYYTSTGHQSGNCLRPYDSWNTGTSYKGGTKKDLYEIPSKKT